MCRLNSSPPAPYPCHLELALRSESEALNPTTAHRPPGTGSRGLNLSVHAPRPKHSVRGLSVVVWLTDILEPATGPGCNDVRSSAARSFDRLCSRCGTGSWTTRMMWHSTYVCHARSAEAGNRRSSFLRLRFFQVAKEI
jgi:hypothetical protein